MSSLSATKQSRECTSAKFLCQNVRSLSSKQSPEVKIEEIKVNMNNNHVIAMAIQETWRPWDKADLNKESRDVLGDDFVMVENGIMASGDNLKGTGVAIILSPEGAIAFKKAGSKVLRFGPRIIGVHLQFIDEKGELTKIFFVSVYAPTTKKKRAEKDRFYVSLSECVEACKEDEQLVMGGDFNAATGVSAARSRDKSLGNWGKSNSNAAGAELCSFMDTHELASATSFFI
jgi:exonuclease III